MVHENLKGRVAVVTGGGGVLCGDFAKTLAKQKCQLPQLSNWHFFIHSLSTAHYYYLLAIADIDTRLWILHLNTIEIV